MSIHARMFQSINEPYAAGLYEAPDKGYFYRHALGAARYFEALRPTPYNGELLYPSGNAFFDPDYAVRPHYCRTYMVDTNLLFKKSPVLNDFLEPFTRISTATIGWYHSAPNYKRIIKEGLSSYRDRLLAKPAGEFRDGLLLLLNGFENYLQRSVAYLESVGAPKQLTDALKKVPFQPAETYYEGLVAWNVIYYFDGADNLGYLDDGLAHLYNGEDLTDVIKQLFRNLDAMETWSCTIGGKQYNQITLQALRAINRQRRPLLELRVRPDMPQECWDIALETIKNGSSNPSFYNEIGIQDMLRERFPNIPEEELAMFVGCGCTETNLQGTTRSGGTDEDVPLLWIFEQYMHENLPKKTTFEEFYEGVCADCTEWADAHLDIIATHYEYMAEYLPNPIRSLLFDDCIDKGKDFNAGGARYTWTQSAHSGLINVIDSLAAIRELIYEKKIYTPEDFLAKLSAEDPGLYSDLQKCPCYGVDDERTDLLAADFTEKMYAVYRNKPSRGFIDAFLLTEHQFTRYEWRGSHSGPTPDGRKKGEPTCDSIASLRGKAVEGPTAMLCSCARLPQHMADGIAVTNLTIPKSSVDKGLRPLIEGYFSMGGIQIQVTCTSKEELLDAYENPEKHRDLIVRVGGYSDYFINLSPALRKAIVDRNIHEA